MGKYWCDENGYLVGDCFVDIVGETYYFSDYVRAKGFTKVGDNYYLFNNGNGKMANHIPNGARNMKKMKLFPKIFFGNSGLSRFVVIIP